MSLLEALGGKYCQSKEHAFAYFSGRPEYPQNMVDTMIAHMRKDDMTRFDKAVDLGCGNGQATKLLASYFKEVLGIDISEEMIALTKSQRFPENVSFTVSSAEEMSLGDSSVDLILVAQAAHFFDMEKFYTEVNRVLRPGGCICLMGYGLLAIQGSSCDEALNNHIMDFKHNKIKGNFGSHMFDNLCSDVMLPYPQERTDLQFRDPNMTVARYIKYISGWRTFQDALEQNPDLSKELETLENHILETLGTQENSEDAKITVVAPAFVIIGRKPH